VCWDGIAPLAFTRYKNAVERVSKLIDELFGEWTSVYNRGEYYIRPALEKLRTAAGDYLPRSGYRCEFDVRQLPENLVMRDFGRVTASLFAVLTLALELSNDRRISQRAYYAASDDASHELFRNDGNNDSRAVFEFSFNSDLPEKAHLTASQISEYAELFPEYAVELAVIGRLTLYRGWSLVCFAEPDKAPNTLIRIEMRTDENGIVYGAPSADPRSEHSDYAELFALAFAAGEDEA
ncbi:MAG: hypothetical protein WCQ72_05505, partial [Eubacteriales bacterium]